MIFEKKNWKVWMGGASIVVGILFVSVVLAWSSPTNTPPGGSGSIRAGTSGNRYNLGIGLSGVEQPLSSTTVKGNLAVGNTFAFLDQSANPSGAIIEGYVGIGTTTPISRLSVDGGIAIEGTLLKFTHSQRIPRNNLAFQIDAGASTHISTTIGSDGLPVIAYVSGGLLKIAKCRALDCSNAVITSAGASQGHTSIAVSGDGFPVLSHINTNVVVYKCDNIDCTTGHSTTLPSTQATFSTSLVIAPNGFPIIAYRNVGSRLGYISCSAPDCSLLAAINQLDSTLNSGRNVSLAIGGDGLPKMSYFTNPDVLRFIHCGDLNCTSGGLVVVDIDDGVVDANLGQYTSLTFGKNGNPIISYYGGDTAKTLKVAVCDDQFCTTSITRTIDDPVSDVGTFTSITTDPMGIPIIIHLDDTNDQLRFTRCGLQDCSSSINWSRNLGSTFNAQQHASVVIGSDGLPFIAYRLSNGALGVLKCGSEICMPNWARR